MKYEDNQNRRLFPVCKGITNFMDEIIQAPMDYARVFSRQPRSVVYGPV